MRGLNQKFNPMEITLKNIKYFASGSQETNCFTATLYIDGVKRADVENNGHGGPTNIRAYGKADRDAVEAAELYMAALPEVVASLGDALGDFSYKQSLETKCDDLLTDFLQGKEEARFIAKIKRECDNGLVYGNSKAYSRIRFNHSIADLLTREVGRKFIVDSLKKHNHLITGSDNLLNTNIPADIIKLALS